MKKLIQTILLGLSLLVSTWYLGQASASQDPIYTGFLSNSALQGYDPVAYFKQGKPVKGKDAYSLNYKGADFYFSTAQNRADFEANPEYYAPQYGGYCAWAVSQGYTAKGDANHWRIIDGKLYLNYSAGVQKNWEVDISGHIKSGDANWPRVLN